MTLFLKVFKIQPNVGYQLDNLLECSHLYRVPLHSLWLSILLSNTTMSTCTHGGVMLWAGYWLSPPWSASLCGWPTNYTPPREHWRRYVTQKNMLLECAYSTTGYFLKNKNTISSSVCEMLCGDFSSLTFSNCMCSEKTNCDSIKICFWPCSPSACTISPDPHQICPRPSGISKSCWQPSQQIRMNSPRKAAPLRMATSQWMIRSPTVRIQLSCLTPISTAPQYLIQCKAAKYILYVPAQRGHHCYPPPPPFLGSPARLQWGNFVILLAFWST